MANTHKVQLRGGFSDRNGISSISTEMQTSEFDNRTRMAISNLFYRFLVNEINWSGINVNYVEVFFNSLIEDVYQESRASFYYLRQYLRDYYNEYIESVILQSDYSEILSLVEYLIAFCKNLPSDFNSRNGRYRGRDSVMSQIVNDIFEREYVGYRIINGKATAITDKVEVDEINKTLATKFDGCKSHIQKALAFLSDRDNPDYKNSIKESISAVESICQIIVEKSSATLGEAINKMESKGLNLHPALKKAFSALYGYTSDQGGIRHAEGMFTSNVTFEEAKDMIVSCCTFVNYLIAEYGKIK